MENQTFPQAIEYLLRDGYGIKRADWISVVHSVEELVGWGLTADDVKAKDWVLI